MRALTNKHTHTHTNKQTNKQTNTHTLQTKQKLKSCKVNNKKIIEQTKKLIHRPAYIPDCIKRILEFRTRARQMFLLPLS